jgi:hypothetical protein
MPEEADFKKIQLLIFNLLIFAISNCYGVNDITVLRIGDGGAFEKRQPNFCTNAQ